MRKIFSVLEYMSDSGRKLSIQEISAALNISTPTIHRILVGLKELGYVEQYTNKQYYLTFKLFALSGDVIDRDNALDQILPIMNYFSLRYGCEAGLTGFDESSIIHIISVGKCISYAMQTTPGKTCPAYCTAAGKLYLAQLGKAELQDFISNACIVPHTHNTIIDRDELLREVELTKRQGYGLTVGELYDTMASVAFPVHNGAGAIIGTINLNFSIDQFNAQVDDNMIKEVQSALVRYGV